MNIIKQHNYKNLKFNVILIDFFVLTLKQTNVNIFFLFWHNKLKLRNKICKAFFKAVVFNLFKVCVHQTTEI